MRVPRFFRIILSLSTLLIALTPAVLLARAGGGGHFSGGGGHGGGGGGGGDGGLIQLLIWLIISQPAIGIPVVIIVILFFIYSQRKGVTLYQDSVIIRSAPAMQHAKRAAVVAQLQQDDPAFNESEFIQRISRAFIVTQNAWSHHDLRPIRPFVSDGVYERFTLQIDEQKSLGLRDLMDQIAIHSVSFINMTSGSVFQEIAVRIAASAADYEVSLADGHRLRGDITPEPFCEIWTFLRRTGTRTIPGKPGLLEGNCPNCGALIEMNQSANCTHCGASLRSGQFDWVLVEITQESEWRDVPVTLPGTNELQQLDPMFNPQDLEDSASVMFWRLRTAERLSKVDPLRKVAAPEFCDNFARQLSTPSQHPWFGEVGVGSVRTRGVLLDDTTHRALIEVIWSGTRFITQNNTPQPTNETGVIHSLFVLTRSAAARTNPDISVSSAHCPKCGAPEDSSASSNCAYCNTPLTTGDKSWVLANVYPMSSPESTSLLMALRASASPPLTHPSIPDPSAIAPSDLTLLAWSVKLACADGDLASEELSVLQQIAERHHIPSSRLDQFISAARAGQLQTPQPANLAEATLWIRTMATTAMADGRLDPQELALLRSLATPFGLTDADLKQILAQARANLYAEARTALRQSRTPRP